MSTANVIVNKALRIIGATSPIKEARPEVINEAFEVFQDMLELWTSQNINLGITIPTVIGDELDEPEQTKLAMEFNLAVTVAPYLQKFPTAEAINKAAQTMQQLRTQFSPQPVTTYPSTLPIGTGNKAWPIGPTYYPDQDDLATDTGIPITT